MQRIEQHAETLSGRDLTALADQHAPMRSMHEEMREGHHHMMDTINSLSKAVEEDSSSARRAMSSGLQND